MHALADHKYRSYKSLSNKTQRGFIGLFSMDIKSERE